MESIVSIIKSAISLLLSLIMLISNAGNVPAVPETGDVNTVYVNAAAGLDENDGSFENPVKTISRGVELADGERPTVLIAAGEYPETVTVDKDGITVKGNGTVTVTGGEKLDGKWEKYKGFIYKKYVDEEVESVFVGNEQMISARWPNADYSDLCYMKRAETDEGTDSLHLVDKKLPKIDMTGALLTIWAGSGWVTFSRTVTSCEKGRSLSWEQPIRSAVDDNPEGMDCYVPQKNNEYYVSGLLDLLDSAGEWYYDKEASMLYLYAPGGRNPEKCDVFVKVRDCGLKIGDVKNVTVENIDIFGCAVACSGTDCVLDGVNLKCADFINDANYFDLSKYYKVKLSGTGNVWKNSEISDSWGDGVYVSGENNTVENCYIHDVCYMGTNFGCVNVSGVGNAVINCTLGDTGRYHVLHSGAKKIRIIGCEMYNSALLSYDCGSTYEWGTDGEGSEIAYNYIHDNREVGIYLDNNSSNFYVHDNVLKKNGIGITLNSHNNDCLVENNYLIKNDINSSTYFYEKDGPSMAGTVIRGNTYTPAEWRLVEGENAPVFEDNTLVKTAIGVKLPDRTYGCDF